MVLEVISASGGITEVFIPLEKHFRQKEGEKLELFIVQATGPFLDLDNHKRHLASLNTNTQWEH